MEYIERNIKMEKSNILKLIDEGSEVHLQDWLIFRNTFAKELDSKIGFEYYNVFNYLCKTYNKNISRDSIYYNKISPHKTQYIYDFEELINFKKTEMGFSADKGDIIAKLIINIEFE
jgi:hypothetical protein